MNERRSKRIPEWAMNELVGSSDPDGDAEALQIASRIMKSYGGENALRELISMFEHGAYISDIGEKYEVTKQRVSQWRKALGCVQEKFTARPVVLKVLKEGITNA